MNHTPFRASADLREAVEAHAAALGITLSEDMRLALKEYYHLMAVFAMVVFVYLLDTFVDLATAILD